MERWADGCPPRCEEQRGSIRARLAPTGLALGKRRCVAAIHAAMEKNYRPLTGMFGKVIDRSRTSTFFR